MNRPWRKQKSIPEHRVSFISFLWKEHEEGSAFLVLFMWKIPKVHENTPIAYRPLQSRLPVLNFSELFNLALIHILIQFPRCIFIRQGAPLH